jgi:clorobiocin biosynthesis protein CloN5
MTVVASQTEIRRRLLEFVRARFLGGDPRGELDEQTPLLELGILDSLNTAVLLTFIKDELAVRVPHADINATNFATVTSIATTVSTIAAA